MALPDLLREIDVLYQELQKLKPLKKEDEERLWKKFRLEWNYNSNHLEGNTLTYNQTELLLMFDKITGDHEVRELEEMKAHDTVVNLIKQYAADKSRDLTETDIRQWNKTILVRPFWSDAQTQSGQPTRKLITPGEYKKEPNSVLLGNGEMFHYASPEETPVLMQELIEWYRKESKEKNLHPIELAALIHYKFVRIHPFDDSNGRTARLLMNFVLLKNDYPPVIIKSGDKKNYLFALNKADVGDLDSFVEYIGKELIWSLQLNIKAARGESTEEIDDIDKEIAIWKREFTSKNSPKEWKTIEFAENLYKSSIRDLLFMLVEKHKHFEDLFQTTTIKSIIQEGNKAISSDNHSLNSNWIKFIDKHYSHDYLLRRVHGYEQSVDKIEIEIEFKNLKANPPGKAQLSTFLSIELSNYSYLIKTRTNRYSPKKYTENFSPQEINQIVNESVKKSFEDLKALIN